MRGGGCLTLWTVDDTSCQLLSYNKSSESINKSQLVKNQRNDKSYTTPKMKIRQKKCEQELDQTWGFNQKQVTHILEFFPSHLSLQMVSE